jgi:methylamine dehydrogenase accessory protein MauD
MPLGWMIVEVIQCLAIIVLAVIMLGVLRQITPVLEQSTAARALALDPLDQGPRVGERLPQFTAWDTGGVALDEGMLNGRASVLLFLSAGCGPCENLAQEISQADLGKLSDELVIVTDSHEQGGLGTAGELPVLIEPDGSVSGVFGIRAKPFAVAVDGAGIVRGSRGANKIRDLDSLAEMIRPGNRTVRATSGEGAG